MTIEDANTVDAIGTERSTGVVVLSILDNLPWDDSQSHFLALQAKLNRYFGFLEQGELSETYACPNDCSIRIDIHCKYPPIDELKLFLKDAAEVAADYGATLTCLPPTVPTNSKLVQADE